jgi:hypothetical protein
VFLGDGAQGIILMAKRSNTGRAKSPRGAGTVGAAAEKKMSMARGAGAGANQGGAPRGASRLEPSTTRKGTGRVSGKRETQKGRGRAPR